MVHDDKRRCFWFPSVPIITGNDIDYSYLTF
jgi:hypothetical protein